MSDKKTALSRQAETIIKNLEKRNMEGYYFETAAACTEAVLAAIPSGSIIGWGGSESLKECGLMDAIHGGSYELLDRSNAKSPEEARQIYARTVLADYFFMSSNAITLDGELINIDGNGNRVACLIQGPSNVIVIAGMNKIVPDVQSGIGRIRNSSGPQSSLRGNRRLP